MEDKISKYLEHAFLAMAVIASINCLARTDFNFPFALFFYHLWHTANNNPDTKFTIWRRVLLLTTLLTVFDLVWLILMGSVWHSSARENVEAWESLAGIHHFVLFLSWMNWILKVTARQLAIIAALGFLYKEELKDPRGLVTKELAYDMNTLGAP